LKKEYYLTDVVEILSRSGKVDAVRAGHGRSLGINDRLDLAKSGKDHAGTPLEE